MGYRQIVIGIAILLFASVAPTLAQTQGAAAAANPDAAYVVTYLETVPERSNEVTALLRTYRKASSESAGNLRSVLLERLDRRGQFVVLTAWQNVKAWESHLAAEQIVALRKQLSALRSAPLDDRLNGALFPGALAIPRNAGAVYAVTHVDVVSPSKDEVINALQQLGAASRSVAGNLHFEITQQASRPNHFAVVEAWRSRAAFDGQLATPSRIAFRDQLGPMSGALYDERLYRWLD